MRNTLVTQNPKPLDSRSVDGWIRIMEQRDQLRQCLISKMLGHEATSIVTDIRIRMSKISKELVK